MVAQNEAKAVEWYRKAVAQDYDEGWCCLACCYNLGIGLKKDHLEAIRLYLIAAERGHPRHKTIWDPALKMETE